MRRQLPVFALVAMLISAPSVGASQDDFCAGFTEGYRSVRGDAAKVPACPAEVDTPDGSDPFREGVKAGIRAARKR